MRTTCVPGGSFRGFGGTQASWAGERQMDMIARRIGIDPLEFRMRNFLGPMEPFAPGDSGMDSDLRAGMTEVAERLAATGPCPPGRGRGYAVGLKDAGGTGNHAQAILKVTQGGEGMLSAAVVEIGQNAGAALGRIAADVLGHSRRERCLCRASTPIIRRLTTAPMSVAAPSSPALRSSRRHWRFAGRSSISSPTGSAVRLASITLDGWTARVGNHVHPLEPMIRAHYGGIGWEFIGRGAFKEPYDMAAPLRAKNMCWMPCWSGAEVEVDRETGRVIIHRLIVGADAGRAVNVQACHGQIEGAAMQALSQAMFEELRYDGANPENATPRGYRVAQTCDVPRISRAWCSSTVWAVASAS